MAEPITTLPPRTRARQIFDVVLGFTKAHELCGPDAHAERERIAAAAEFAIQVSLEPLEAEIRRLRQRVEDLTSERR